MVLVLSACVGGPRCSKLVVTSCLLLICVAAVSSIPSSSSASSPSQQLLGIRQRQLVDDYDSAADDVGELKTRTDDKLSSSDAAAADTAASRLILKLVDVAIQDAIERGASQSQARVLLRKRSGLRKCFFHAINCW